MSTAAAIRQMLAAGLTIEQALIAVEAMEQHAKAPEPVVVERPVGASAIRMRRLRERRHEASQVTNSVTSDVTVTQKEKSPTPPKEKTTPLPQTPSVSESSPAIDKPEKPKRATRLGSDWLPSDRNRSDAIEAGVPLAMIDRMGNGFRDYWIAKPGKDGAKLDWDATWRNWCRREAERRGWAPTLENGAAPTVPGRVYIRHGTIQWDAWREHRGGRSLPTDATGNGWYCETEWPPGWSQKKEEPKLPLVDGDLEAF